MRRNPCRHCGEGRNPGKSWLSAGFRLQYPPGP